MNLSGVLWLSGTSTEINSFISDAVMKHNAVKLGHADNIRSLLIRAMNQQTMEGIQPYIMSKDKKVESAFILLQGSIIGLLVTEEVKKENEA